MRACLLVLLLASAVLAQDQPPPFRELPTELNAYLGWLYRADQARYALHQKAAKPIGRIGKDRWEQVRRDLAATGQEVGLFPSSLLRGKPPVPQDYRQVDNLYAAVLQEDTRLCRAILAACDRQDVRSLTHLAGGKGIGAVNARIGPANKELERVYQAYGITGPRFMIRSKPPAYLDAVTPLIRPTPQ